MPLQVLEKGDVAMSGPLFEERGVGRPQPAKKAKPKRAKPKKEKAKKKR
jgi:hypothetical protein